MIRLHKFQIQIHTRIYANQKHANGIYRFMVSEANKSASLIERVLSLSSMYTDFANDILYSKNEY